MSQRAVLALLCGSFVLLGATRASALAVDIGGIDSESQYTNTGAVPAEGPGVFTFYDSRNLVNPAADGIITSSNMNGAGACVLICGGRASLSVLLSPLQDNGTSVFDPASTNVKRARFVGTGGNDFVIWDPNNSNIALLSFSVTHIDVATAAIANPIAGDNDGSITLGGADLNTYGVKNGSALILSGGTLNQLVGGLGVQAVLGIFIASPTPAILTTADFKGYLGANFTSGSGPPAPAGLTWDLRIDGVLLNPEPSTALLVATGLVGLVAVARRRDQRS